MSAGPNRPGSRILPGANVVRTVGTAGEGVVVESTSPANKPGLKAEPGRLQELELERAASLLPHDSGSGSHSAAADEFTDPDFHNVDFDNGYGFAQLCRRKIAVGTFLQST